MATQIELMYNNIAIKITEPTDKIAIDAGLLDSQAIDWYGAVAVKVLNHFLESGYCIFIGQSSIDCLKSLAPLYNNDPKPLRFRISYAD